MKGCLVCCVLLLILGFMMCATDASRPSVWIMENQVALPQIRFQDEIDTASDKVSMRNDESTTRRLDLEDMDYGGTGANDRHDPKSPGRA